MQIIHEMDGKTVNHITTVDGGNMWCFYFTDGTNKVIEVGEQDYEDGIVFRDEVSIVEQYGLGLISKEEYNAILEETRKWATENREKQERRTLEMLKQKYGE